MERRRGFSVLEFAIALAIAGIVVTTAASMAVGLSRNMRYEEKRAQVDADARRLVDFLVGNAQAAGGGPVRPWVAIWREEACGARNGLPTCGGSDRLTLLDVDPARAACSITGLSSSALTVPTNGDGSCCFDWSGTPVSGAANQYDQTPLLLVRDDKWIMRRATQAAGSSCVMGLSTVDHLDATETANPPVGRGDGEREPASLSDLVGGSAVAVRPRTLYVDHTGHRLMEWFDVDGDGTADADEQRVVFPGVYDFQVAVGYDGAPENGRLAEGPSTSDEWLGNVAADALPAGVRDDHLRMLSFGIITGVRYGDAPVRTEQVFNGPSLTTSGTLRGVLLRKGMGHAMLRNLLVFF
jgi:prepilin-type N-terminal cleavage/methylation domain-containing protein